MTVDINPTHMLPLLLTQAVRAPYEVGAAGVEGVVKLPLLDLHLRGQQGMTENWTRAREREGVLPWIVLQTHTLGEMRLLTDLKTNGSTTASI